MNPLILGMSVLGQIASSSGYDLVQFENSDYRNWSFDELSTRVGVSNESLMQYRCNGVQEFELLPALKNPTGKSGSLRVKLQASGEMLIYRAGDLFFENGDRYDGLSDSFGESVRETLRDVERTPSGAALIERISNSPFPIQITLGSPRFGPVNDEGVVFRGLEMAQALQSFVTLRKPDYVSMQFNRIGAGGSLFYNPQGNYSSVEADGVRRKTPSAVIIAHEMYHAFDSIRGLLDRRFVHGAGYEPLEVAEFRAVRFENTLRKELGFRYRKFYGNSPSGGVIDTDGRPYVIPAPCLHE